MIQILVVTTSGAAPYAQRESMQHAEIDAAELAGQIEDDSRTIARWLREWFVQNNMNPPRVVLGVQVLAESGESLFFRVGAKQINDPNQPEKRRTERPTDSANSSDDRSRRRRNETIGGDVGAKRRDVLQKLRANGPVFDTKRAE